MALCKCEDNVLRCVEYDKAASEHANDDEGIEFECVGCKNSYDANNILLVSIVEKHLRFPLFLIGCTEICWYKLPST